MDWYEENSSVAFDFENETINNDVVLYASWKGFASASQVPTVKSTLTYNGEPQLLIENNAVSSSGTVMYQVVSGSSLPNSAKWTSDTTKITAKDVGSYGVWYYVKGDDDHSDSEPKLISTVNIQKFTNTWETEPQINDWTYNTAPDTPSYKAKFGEVKVTYSGKANDGSMYSSEEPPINAGSYKATFTVEGTDNYTGLDTSVDFVIEKATRLPSGNFISSEDETIDGKGDGKITALNGNMEYRKKVKKTIHLFSVIKLKILTTERIMCVIKKHIITKRQLIMK